MQPPTLRVEAGKCKYRPRNGMPNQRQTRNWTWVLLLVLGAAFGANLAAADEKVEEIYKAFAVNMSNVGAGTSAVVEVHVTRWSTEAERQALLTTLIEKGQEEFVKALRKEKEAGWFRSTARAGARSAFPSVRLHYAHQYEEGGKRHMTLVTDRPIGGREAVRDARTLEYDVTTILLEVPAEEGSKEKGKGQFIVGMNLGFDKEKKKLVIESYATEPIRLTEVHRTK
jgi:hypothetical protein